MRRLAVIFALVLLAGCHDDGAENRLPEGCVMHDLGSYRSNKVLVVQCDGRPTTSTNTRRSAGKTSSDSLSVEVGK